MTHVALIGFGEAGQAFAGASGWRGPTRVHDLKGKALARAYAAAGVRAEASAARAVEGAALVLSVVTADQALAAAQDAAAGLAAGALYCDLNSVAPETKRRAAEAVEARGARYIDVAVMSPVHPARLGAPLLISGPHAEAAAEALGSVGFSRVSVVAGEVGRASAVKMIRSVMVKGIEALSAECVLAAASAGVVDAVLSSLDASPPPAAWAARVDYNLERMMAHGLRRASEMEQVVETLEALGDPAPMSRAAVERQRAIGRLGLSAAPPGLDDKIAAILGRREESAAV